MTFTTLPPGADNDNEPVFDRGRESTRLSLDSRAGQDWTPPRSPKVPRGREYFTDTDRPTVEYRIRAGQAFYSSGRYSGQAANDNKDWPLQKLLKAEGDDHHLRIAERYRDMWNAANMPHDLVGRDMADNIFLLHRTDINESTGALQDKGLKKLTGRRAKVDTPATRATVADPEKTRQRAKPIPKKWTGDWPLLHRIDASRELSEAQAALGWLRQPFEAAVVGGETLETIGREHGVGNKAGAKGGGRALVFLGLQCIDEFWRKPQRRGNVVNIAWAPGEPVPEGYYQSVVQPDAIFRRAA